MRNDFSNVHKALMPLSLANKIITNFTNENDVVIDPFSGIGTTFMSCIQNKRRYFGIELEPLYCQETIRRYLQFSYNHNIKIIRNNETIYFNDFRDELNYKASVADNQLEIKKCGDTQYDIFDY